MESIIIAAIGGALGNLGSDTVKAGYRKLKELLLRKSGAAGALESLEQKPDSANRKGVLQEELEAAGADKDAEIIKAAEELLALMGKAQPGGASIIQTASGDHSKVISVVGGQHVSINA